MKNALILIFLILSKMSTAQIYNGTDKPQVKFYGNEFKLNMHFTDDENYFSGMITEGKVLSSCPKKGCWVKVISNSEELFVTFKDYSFFVPKEGIRGKNILIKGKVKVDTISVAQQKHYAFDAGESEDDISKIKNPKITKSIIAEGVAIIN